MEESRERLIANLKESGGTLRVRSALNPILWLCGIVAVPCISALAYNPNANPVITYVLYSVVGTAVVSFLFLLLFDRDRLHSEEYLLRNRNLDLIQEKGSKKAIDAATVQVLSQPEFLALTEEQQGGSK